MKISNKLPNRIPMDRIMSRLAAAYDLRAANTKPEGSQWQQDVMRSVRQIGLHGEKNKTRFLPGQLAWRLAPATLALIILMAVMIIQVDDTIEYQMASLEVSDPVQPYLTYKPF